MDAEILLKNALTLMGLCHIPGTDAGKFAGAMENIKTAIKMIKEEKEAKKEAKPNEDDH